MDGQATSLPTRSTTTTPIIRLGTFKFSSANFGGFKFGGLYGFSNSTNFADNRSFSLGASYTFGGLAAAASYMKISSSGGQAAGPLTNDTNFVASKQTVYGAGISTLSNQLAQALSGPILASIRP